MDTSVAKDMIRVIRAERDHGKRVLRETEDPDMGDPWPFMGEPFINELCLTLLVAIWHHVERELVLLAAKVTSDGRELDGEDYGKLVQEEREQLRKRGKVRIAGKLKLQSTKDYVWGDKSMKVLNLLANSYKHEPMATPDKALLECLGLDASRDYAPLPESPTLQEGLAAFLNLRDSADYCDIADELVARVDRFLAEVKEQKLVLSPVRRFRAMNPDDYLY